MDMDMDMDHGAMTCKMSMLWNWYTIDACFLAASWRITSNAMFAASCIGVMLIVVLLEFLRRLGKEYDNLLLRQFQRHVEAQTDRGRINKSPNGTWTGNGTGTGIGTGNGSNGGNGNATSTSTSSPSSSSSSVLCASPQFVTFRATPLQQLVRAVLHAATFGLAYIIMLLAMYYNGYLIICIILGSGLGKFVCDWMVHKVLIGRDMPGPGPCALEEPTVCCG